jgi:hypothetical protein
VISVEQLPCVGGVADRGVWADAEHGGKVEWVAAHGDGFFELPVDPQHRSGFAARRGLRVPAEDHLQGSLPERRGHPGRAKAAPDAGTA